MAAGFRHSLTLSFAELELNKLENIYFTVINRESSPDKTSETGLMNLSIF